jgi:hypothetical protein
LYYSSHIIGSNKESDMIILMTIIGALALAGLVIVLTNIWYDLLERGWEKD